jgi:LemA protein
MEMTGSLIVWLVFVGLVFLLGAWFIRSYNGLVGLRNQVKAAWAQIDVQLRRRHDLIPNLVETVKGFASHEKETLEKVIQARSRAVTASGVDEQCRAEGELSAALRQLMMVVEQYPDLKANQNFLALQEELTSTENRIAGSRQHYNDSVRTYNTKTQSLPTNLIASGFNFKEAEFFEVQEEEVREAPVVQF